MKITEVNITEPVASIVGLKPISMKKIGSTILLAGKNGSGKTRILNLIRQQINNLHSEISNRQQFKTNIITIKKNIEQQLGNKRQFYKQIKEYEQNIKSNQQRMERKYQEKEESEQNIKSYEQNIVSFKQQIEQEPQQKEQLEENIRLYVQSINSTKLTIENQLKEQAQSEVNIKANQEYVNTLRQKIEQQPQEKQKYEEQIKQQQDILKTPLPIVFDKEQPNITVVDFVPNRIELQDWSNLSKQEWEQRATQATSSGVETLYISTIPLIHLVSDRWFNATHPESGFTEHEIQKYKNDYSRLQDIIDSFLGEKIRWRNGHSTIFDKPIHQAQLSAGQRILLQLCVAIYAQGGTLSNHIIFMDEPENHLHPSAVIDLLDTIKTHNPDGQIWIATHSIPLLSHFDTSSLWFVEDGIVKHSGKKPELVLRSLLGDEERIQKLRDFTSLPSELARNRFAFECLCPPTVVETNSSDAQSIQLNDQLKVIWNGKESISLLDFGAGKGRMIANLSDYENISQSTLDYHAYDPFDSDKDYCLHNISLTYDDYEARYHNSIDELRTKVDDNHFNVIVLSNVLHEIPHSQWCGIFTDMSILLKDDGYFLLIEDCLIPTGELPHSNGFLVFSTLHLKKLFNIPALETKFIKHDARFDSEEQRGRLMAHLIPKQYLSNISQETIQDALKELKQSSKTEIQKIRERGATYSNGLAHSFWIQQLANAELCIEEFGGN